MAHSAEIVSNRVTKRKAHHFDIIARTLQKLQFAFQHACDNNPAILSQFWNTLKILEIHSKSRILYYFCVAQFDQCRNLIKCKDFSGFMENLSHPHFLHFLLYIL